MTSELPDLGFEYRFRPPSNAQGPSGSPPTLVLLHGAGGDESSLWAVGDAVGPGVAVLSPRGKVEDDGPRYFRRREPGVADVEDLRVRSEELVQFVSRACDAFGLDPAAVWLFGYSNGATAATALALDHPEALAGGVIFAGNVPFPHHGRVLDGKSFFCGHGRADEQVSPADYEDVVELLVTAGAEIELHWYDSG
ncbi:MAG: dienelactone hydrolase family protein, partial [Acidimicrobiales bacterium]